MKKILTILFVFIISLSLVGCSKKENNNPIKDNYELSDISKDNWVKTIKSNFNIDLILPKGWSIKEVSSPNGQTNAKIVFTAKETTFEEVGESLFNEIKKITVGDIYKPFDSKTTYKTFEEANKNNKLYLHSYVNEEKNKSLIVNYFENNDEVELTLLNN